MYARDMFVPAIIASGGGNVNSALRPPRATRDTLLASLDSCAGTQGYYKTDLDLGRSAVIHSSKIGTPVWIPVIFIGIIVELTICRSWLSVEVTIDILLMSTQTEVSFQDE